MSPRLACILILGSCFTATTVHADKPAKMRVMPAHLVELKAEVVGFIDNRDGKQTDPEARMISRYVVGPYVCSVLRVLREDTPESARVYAIYAGPNANKLTPKELALHQTT